jgi:hypothetical protein
MKLTEQQAVDLAAAMAVAEGMCPAEEVYQRKIYAQPKELATLQEAFSSILTHAIAQGLVVEAAPVKPFVDLRQL